MHDETYADPEFEIAPAALAWAAGLFEGEGCFTISQDSRSGHRQARIKLNSTDRDVVERFSRIIGLGRIREESSQLKRGWKQQWEWYVTAKSDVHEVIEFLWPFLGRRRALRAIDLLVLVEAGK